MRKGLIYAAALLLLAEVAAHLAFDFPLYQADSRVGYRVAPSQSGAFLFVNDWAFNSDGLGVAEEFAPSGKFDVLLVGDSLVYGGNGYRQEDKLGPTLEARTGWQVWPAGAGSWALQNELTFLTPELIQGSDAIVFVVNSGDFDRPSEWASEYTHPRSRPWLFLPYLVRRYLFPPSDPPAPFPVAKRDVEADWRALSKPAIVIAYAAKDETGCSWAPKYLDAICYDPADETYRDDVHPNVRGNALLAEAIRDAVERRLRSPPGH